MTFALGFLTAFAVLALAAALRFRRWRRFHRAPYGPRHPGAMGGRRWPFRRLFARLDTSPAQEQVLVDDASALRAELAALRSEWLALREEIAALVAEPSLDATRVEAVLASRDRRLAEVRRRAAEALARFHAVLDDAQRKALAALVRDGHLLAPAHGHGGRWG
jgi:Spy/CpxP family protein refolding chaperone